VNLLVLDFETMFSDDYTLKKMTTEAYIRDPRFEALGCGFIFPDGSRQWVNGPELRNFLCGFAWGEWAVLAHHAQFDGLILSHHYGIKPRFWYDTLSMARLSLGVHLSVGLDNLARHFGLEGKTVPYNEFRGKRFADLGRDLLGRLGAGCLHDCALTKTIFDRLSPSFPQDEYQTIDTTVRMFTQPVLEADIDQLGEIWSAEELRRVNLLDELGATAKEIGSNETFTALLAAEGVEVEYKQGKNGPIPAFAKTDQFMEELLEDANPRVQALAAARLGIKSTIDQTRAERFGWMASRGRCPVYLRYCGAHTTRWSGGDGVNWQNLRRGGKLRKAIKSSTPRRSSAASSTSSQDRTMSLNAFEPGKIPTSALPRRLMVEKLLRRTKRNVARANSWSLVVATALADLQFRKPLAWARMGLQSRLIWLQQNAGSICIATPTRALSSSGKRPSSP